MKDMGLRSSSLFSISESSESLGLDCMGGWPGLMTAWHDKFADVALVVTL